MRHTGGANDFPEFCSAVLSMARCKYVNFYSLFPTLTAIILVKTNPTGERVSGSVLTFPFLAHCFPPSLFSGVPVSRGLDEVGLACCALTFKGAGLCFALDTLSGANWVSTEGDGGFTSTAFTGVGR